MAFYWHLRRLKTEAHKQHVAERLLALRKALREQVTEKPNVGELKIATWNLMHFGGSGGYQRSPESLMYIAEIIDHFDLVSIQEVKRDLGQLETLVKKHLGGSWDYIVSDTTEGNAGNDERMAVLYRSSKVTFGRLAGEIVLPPGETVVENADIEPDEKLATHRQLARTPYYLGFQANWFKFKLCSVHIHYGAKGGKHKKIRATEIARLAKLLSARSDKEREREVEFAESKKWDTTPSAANYILLGDFNIHKTRDDLSKKALTENGFEVPDDIDGLSTNTGKKEEPFDQIALRLHDERFAQGAGGVFDFRRFVYRPKDSEFYWKTVGIPKLKQRAKKNGNDAEDIKEYFANYYRKNQISDHLLLWTSFKIDYAEDYLKEFLD